MTSKKYSISDTARQLSVETHVLRYWETELGLQISRNAQGHRFYEAKDITRFQQIKYLKEQGFQLKAIKRVLPDLEQVYTMDKDELEDLRDKLHAELEEEEEQSKEPENRPAQIMTLHPKNKEFTKPFRRTSEDYAQAEEKLKHFEAMMRTMIRSTIEELNTESEERVYERITTKLLKELDYLERQKDDLQEKQLTLLQEILEELKKESAEAAATEETAVNHFRSKKKRRQNKKLFTK